MILLPETLLADLLWLEYQDAVSDARAALMDGHKLMALGLAIQAHKIKQRYENAMQDLLLA